MSKLDGGPAFPAEDENRYFHGMSLRDYFAAAALRGFLASYAHPTVPFILPPEEEIAQTVYKYADAMLAARAKAAT